MADTDTLIDNILLSRITEKMERINKLRPLQPNLVEILSQDIRIRHTYHSNAIEGNTLSLQETKVVIEEGITVGGKSLIEHLEAVNNASAYELIENLAKGMRGIDHITIQELHEVVTRGILIDAGKYRTHNVRITGAVKRPPDFRKILKMMDELLKTIRRADRHPIDMAALLHHGLVGIHPFSDGNGRVTRLLTNLYLLEHEFTPIILRKEERRKYYSYLGKADTGDIGPFTNFIARAVEESLIEFLSIMGGDDELLPLGILSKHSKYSQEYLSLRARQGKLAATKIGGVWHSTRRALREYGDRTVSKEI